MPPKKIGKIQQQHPFDFFDNSYSNSSTQTKWEGEWEKGKNCH